MELSRDRKQFAVLIDPDSYGNDKYCSLIQLLREHRPDYILVGGSITSQSIDLAIDDIRCNVPGVPVILFPGNASQFSPKADALLYLSLISGRNPEYLIGQHVMSSIQIMKSGIDVIPTGYILVESGSTTSVEYISGTRPIPRTKPGIAVATAVAGELMGHRAIYLEAGSGALNPVPCDMIRAVRAAISVPLIVGGGICDADAMDAAFDAGADIVVIGTALERDPSLLQRLFV